MKRKIVGWSDSEDYIGRGWKIRECFPAAPCTEAPDSTLCVMEKAA